MAIWSDTGFEKTVNLRVITIPVNSSTTIIISSALKHPLTPMPIIL
jgi:hypothetical protein